MKKRDSFWLVLDNLIWMYFCVILNLKWSILCVWHLPVFIPVHHTCAWCLQRPAEGVQVPETDLQMVVIYYHVQPVLLTSEPSLQPLYVAFFFLNPFIWHLLSSLHMWVNSFINFQIGAVILKLLLTLSVDFFEKVDTVPWSRDALLCKLQLSWPLHLGVVVLSWPAEIVGSAWVGSCDSSGNFSGDELPDLICVFWHRPCCCLEGHCPLFISRFRQEDSSFASGLIFRLLIQWDRPFLRFW